MKKKAYIKPSVCTVGMETAHILAGSGEMNTSLTQGQYDDEEDDEPDLDTRGFFWVD